MNYKNYTSRNFRKNKDKNMQLFILGLVPLSHIFPDKSLVKLAQKLC